MVSPPFTHDLQPVHFEDLADDCPGQIGSLTGHPALVTCLWCRGYLAGAQVDSADGRVEVLKEEV